MSLYVASINSGSNGNCYYVGNDHEAVLVDVGLTCRETEKRMRRIGLSMDNVKAIFISHEHGDHISGLEVIARKYKMPVYITPSTLQHGRLNLDMQLVKTFNHGKPIVIGGLSVHPFTKLHDASDPHSFNITGNGVTIGIFTDIGRPCEQLADHFRQCHAAFLEANYDEEMLENGRYPVHLKRRISGDHGHLSNMQALDVFVTYRPPFMSHLFLAHLSKDNNSPQLVGDLFTRHRGSTKIVVASRYNESEVYHITCDGKVPIRKSAQALVQASLF